MRGAKARSFVGRNEHREFRRRGVIPDLASLGPAYFHQSSAFKDLMSVACVWIDSSTGFVANSHLHLVSVAQSNHIAREQCSIVGENNRRLILMNYMNRNPIKVVAILLEDK